MDESGFVAKSLLTVPYKMSLFRVKQQLVGCCMNSKPNLTSFKLEHFGDEAEF